MARLVAVLCLAGLGCPAPTPTGDGGPGGGAAGGTSALAGNPMGEWASLGRLNDHELVGDQTRLVLLRPGEAPVVRRLNPAPRAYGGLVSTQGPFVTINRGSGHVVVDVTTGAEISLPMGTDVLGLVGASVVSRPPNASNLVVEVRSLLDAGTRTFGTPSAFGTPVLRGSVVTYATDAGLFVVDVTRPDAPLLVAEGDGLSVNLAQDDRRSLLVGSVFGAPTGSGALDFVVDLSTPGSLRVERFEPPGGAMAFVATSTARAYVTRTDPSATELSVNPTDGGPGVRLHLAAAPVEHFWVLGNGEVVGWSESDGGQHDLFASRWATPLEPVHLGSYRDPPGQTFAPQVPEANSALFEPGATRGLLRWSAPPEFRPRLLEVDLTARTATEARGVSPYPLVRRGVAYWSTNGVVMRKALGEAARAVSTGASSCELLTSANDGQPGALSVACADGSLRTIAADDSLTTVAGVEVNHGSAVGALPTSAWFVSPTPGAFTLQVTDVASGSSRLVQRVSRMNDVVSAGHRLTYVVSLADGGEAFASFDDDTGREVIRPFAKAPFPPLFEFFVQPRPDGGRIAVSGELTADGGKALRLIDLVDGTFTPVTVREPEVFPQRLDTQRFSFSLCRQSVCDLIEQSGAVVSAPVGADGGARVPRRELVVRGATYYFAGDVLLDAQLRAVLPLPEGSIEHVTTTANQDRLLLLRREFRDDGGSPLFLETVGFDGGQRDTRELPYAAVFRTHDEGSTVYLLDVSGDVRRLVRFDLEAFSGQTLSSGLNLQAVVASSSLVVTTERSDGARRLELVPLGPQPVAREVTLAGENVVSFRVEARHGKLLFGRVTSDWRSLGLVSVNLDGTQRAVLVPGGGAQKIGHYGLSHDGTVLLTTQSPWDMSGASFVATPLP